MALTVKHSYEIEAPIDLVWAYFADPTQVVPCMPGAELVEVVDQQTYLGRVGIRLGQINLKLEGQVRIQEIDAQRKQMILLAGGSQIGTPGGADADITFSLREMDKTRTEINILADVTVSGKLIQMGGGMIQTTAKFMFDRFSKCTATVLHEQVSPAARKEKRFNETLFGKILKKIYDWFRKLFSN